jgi:hypothetical protein
MESIDRSRAAYSKAISDGRRDDMFFAGLDEIARGIRFINRGDFEYAKKIVDGSVDIFNSAKVSKRGIQNKPAVFDTLADQARTKKVLISTLKHPNMVIFFLTSLALGVIIIQTWLQVYSQIQPLNESPLGLAVAFLLGYGSQSLIGETLDLFKV